MSLSRLRATAVVLAGLLLASTIALAACNDDDESTPTATMPAGQTPGAASPSPAASLPADGEQPTAVPDQDGEPAPTMPPDDRVSPGTPPNAIALDADPDDEAITPERSVASGEQFELGITFTEAGAAYDTYQFHLTWNPEVLSFVEGRHANQPIFAACFRIDAQESSVTTACGAPDGPVHYTGLIAVLIFECSGQGDASLHLVSIEEDSVFGTTAITAVAPIGTSLEDASITCE